MANNNNNNPLKLTGAASMVREEDLEDLDELLKELKGRVHKAREDGRTFMMAHYTRLVALVSPEVTRLRKRFEREDIASFRKTHKALRLAEKTAVEEEEDDTATS